MFTEQTKKSKVDSEMTNGGSCWIVLTDAETLITSGKSCQRVKTCYKYQIETLALGKAASQIKTWDTKDELDTEQGKGHW